MVQPRVGGEVEVNSVLKLLHKHIKAVGHGGELALQLMQLDGVTPIHSDVDHLNSCHSLHPLMAKSKATEGTPCIPQMTVDGRMQALKPRT